MHPHQPLHEHQALLALDGFLRGQAPQAAQPRGSWSFVDGRLSPADSVPTSTTTTTSTSTASVPAPDATLSPDDLFKLLDEISTSGPGTAGAPPPPATPVSPPLVHPSTTIGPFSPSSTSTFTTDSLFPPPPASSLAFDPPFLASSSSSFALPVDQVAPQRSSMSSFAFASKPFDAGASPSLSRPGPSSPCRARTDLVALLRTRAGDILMPFDLEPASAASAPLDLLAFPVFDHLIGTHAAVPSSSSSSAPFHPPAPAPAPSHTDADAAALDALLDSPLGLAASSSSAPSDTSPLSEFLASPMFSLASGAGAGDSTVPPSATMSDLTLPTPSPYEHAYAYSAAAYSAPPPPADGSGLAWFPPLPAAAAGPSSSSSSSSVLFGGAPPTPASTILRPLPPPPSLAPAPLSAFAAPPPAAAPIARGTKRAAPTGFRPGAPPLLPLDAPIQSRHSVMPSATSKRTKTSAAEKALLKRAQSSSSSSSSAAPAPAGAHEPQAAAAAAAEEEQGALPADIVAAVERKRLQNTLSARKSRARKQARVQELEGENELLRRKVGELEALLGLAMAGAGAGAA